jgi:hypothetical protein
MSINCQIIIHFFSFFQAEKKTFKAMQSIDCKTVTVSKNGSQRHYDLFTMSPKAVQQNTKKYIPTKLPSHVERFN